MNYYLESYGCSLNRADSEAIKGFLESNGFTETSLEKAELAVINTCAVKQVTENRMLNRISRLLKEKPKTADLVVFGCLTKINPERLQQFKGKATLLGPSLKELALFLNLPEEEFSLSLPVKKFNKFVSIIPISRGCVFNCSFCCVKAARGKLKSYSVESIKERFSFSVQTPVEVWLTAQDTGSYGLDTGSSLPELLKELLSVEGDYRVRLGMMNPLHLKRIKKELIPLFKDERLYRFLHIPVQSGSDKILKLMNRNYKASEFVSLAKDLRKKISDLTLSTDVIVGFPTETEEEFNETISLLKKVKPDIVNISRFGERPGIKALELSPKVYGWIKKDRSRATSKLCKELSLQKNLSLLGKEFRVFVSEKGKGDSFISRTNSYKPVVLMKAKQGSFYRAKMIKAEPTHLMGQELG